MFSELRSTLTTLVILGRSQWRSRWGRSLLTLLSIAIAVTTIVGVWISGDATQAAYRALSAEVEGQPAIELLAVDETTEPLTPEVEQQLAAAAGVEHILPRVIRGANLRFNGQKSRTLVAGIVPGREEPTQRMILTSGRFLAEGNEALLQQQLAEALGLKLDDEFTIWANGFTRVTLVGTFITPPLQSPPALVLIPLELTADVFKSSGRAEQYFVLTKTTATRDNLLTSLPALLPPGWECRKPIGRAQVPDDLIQSAELGLKFASAMGAVMAAIIVFNTFLMNVNERRRQFAVLRTIGATDHQVLGIVLGEAVLLGILGTIIGILLGWGLAMAITMGISTTLDSPLPLPQLSLTAAALGAIAGPALALLGAYWPAREVCQISPLEGLTHTERPLQSFDYWRVGLLAAGVWAAGYGAMALVKYGTLDKVFIVPAGTLAFAGLLLATPLFISGLIQAASFLLPSRPTLRRLCNEQLLRRRMRTALTLSVLIVAIGNGLGVGLAIQANIDDIRSWFRRLFNSEFIIAAATPLPGVDDAELQQTIAAVAGVQGVAGVRIFSSRLSGKPMFLVARDHLPGFPLSYQLQAGNYESLPSELKNGGAVVASGLAKRLGVQVGEERAFDLEGALIRCKIVGIVNDYMAGGNVVYIDREAHANALPVGGTDWFFVHATDTPETTAALRSLVAEKKLVLTDQRTERQNVERIMSGVVGALWSMLLIGFLVGGFAVANTLSGNILEQTRELGLLRVVGMTAGQAQRLCLRQAFLLGLASLVMGLPIGLLMAADVAYSNEILLGRPVAFQWHWPLIVGNIVAIMLVVLLAGWFPARRVTRLDLTDALSYE